MGTKMLKKDTINLNYFAIILIIIKSMFHYSTIITLPETLEGIIEIFAYSIWGLTLLTSNYSKKNIFFLFCIGSICFYSCYICKSFTIFSSFMFFCLCMSKNSNEKKIIELIYKTMFFVLTFHFIIFLIQYLNGDVLKIVDQTGRMRLSLGFSNPNIVSYYTLWCFLGYIYNQKNLNHKIIIPFFLICIVYLFTKSNTLIFMSIVSLILININATPKFWRNISKYMILSITIIWIVFVNMYSSGNNMAIKLNEILNSRLYYSYEAQKNYGYSIVGHRVNSNIELVREKSYMSTSIILDVTYANLIYKYGIVYILILILISNIIAESHDDLRKKYLIIWSIFAISETVSLNFIICFPPALAAFLLKERKKDCEDL